MYFPGEVSHMMKVNEMLDQVDELFSELRLEYCDMANRYDEALRQIEELEADLISREEMDYGLV